MKPEHHKDIDRIQELVDELDEHGSASDPIWIDNNDDDPDTASDLVNLPEYTSLHKKFVFYGKNGMRHGTLKQMVIDRGGTGRHREEPEEPDKCETCGRALE